MKISSRQRPQTTKNNAFSERTTRSSSTPRSLRQSDLGVKRSQISGLNLAIDAKKRQAAVPKRNNKFSMVAKRKLLKAVSKSEEETSAENMSLAEAQLTGVERFKGEETACLEQSKGSHSEMEVETSSSAVTTSTGKDDSEPPETTIVTSIADRLAEISTGGDKLLEQSEDKSNDKQQGICDSPSTSNNARGRTNRKRRNTRTRFAPKKKSKLTSKASKEISEGLSETEDVIVDNSGSFIDSSLKEKHRVKRDRGRLSLMKELQTSTGFVDKVDLSMTPGESMLVRRKPRMASLNAIAKVNAVLESYSPLAGRSMHQVREIAQAKKTDHGLKPKQDKRRKRSTSSVTQTDDILFFASMKSDNNEWLISGGSANDVFKQPTFVFDEQPISDSRVSSTSNLVCEDEYTMTKDKAVQTVVNHKAVQTDAFLLDDVISANSPSSCTCGYLDSISLNENVSPTRSSTVCQTDISAANVAIASTVYRIPPTITTNTLHVPLCSSISTKTTTHTIAIPFTKMHQLVHTDMRHAQAVQRHGPSVQNSKRMASLNAIAMMNAMKVFDRPLFDYPHESTEVASRRREHENFGKQGPNQIRVPKINFQATSTSKFSIGSKGKVVNPVKAAHIKNLSSQIEQLIDTKKQTVRPYCKMVNGWILEGEPVEKPFAYEDRVVIRRYYSSMRRNDEVINVRDAVLLKSGPRKKDLPFVARVSGIWEEDEGLFPGDMMMSVFWYYRPEQTEGGKQPGFHGELEVLASRHRDDNSAACIVDKCYVLSYPQYCRFRARNKLYRESRKAPLSPVPPAESTRPGLMPPPNTDPNLVFFCRLGYDSRTGKTLKNPFY